MQQLKQTLLRVDTAQSPPPSADVVVIGAGAAGIATAYELTRLGASVAVIEKGWVAAEQSSRNWGWCRTLGRDIRELEMAKLSVDLWRHLKSETGADVGFRETGVVFVTDNPKELQTWERWHGTASARGVPSKMLSAREANATHAWGKSAWIGGIRTERDGYAEPSRAIPLLAKHTQEQGAKIVQQCAVNELLIEGGRIAGVQTEKGIVRAKQVVLAGGAWSSMFCRKHRLRLPILQVHSSASKSLQFDTGGRSPARATQFSFRDREDGGLTLAKSGRGTMHVVPDLLRYGMKFRDLYQARKANVNVSLGRKFFAQLWDEFRYFYLNQSPYIRHRVLDPKPDMNLVRSAYEDAAALFSGMGPNLIDRAWGGVIDNTPDGIPIISDVARLPGLFLCTGFSGHGFSSSLGAGRSLAQLMVHGRAEIALDDFSYERLIDGRRLQPSILY
ncbi:NAD(P)/FAD-dependent oxidoreductase [Bordetella genomosp. 4]|uniref:Amino acid deaminase n=1 Tax=Bordetella genomosp. 4 TaxID=463044 RepID=A0A261TX26_9BORD|nr:FAD-binding oxidoreductase [Bordetella genomosp. 4]OZI45278.1 amino acid deaminase [Bordetella genomosp. 4]OZI53173.1 amino acid deaminase [Bordetella genomosp. 4]